MTGQLHSSRKLRQDDLVLPEVALLAAIEMHVLLFERSSFRWWRAVSCPKAFRPKLFFSRTC